MWNPPAECCFWSIPCANAYSATSKRFDSFNLADVPMTSLCSSIRHKLTNWQWSDASVGDLEQQRISQQMPKQCHQFNDQSIHLSFNTGCPQNQIVDTCALLSDLQKQCQLPVVEFSLIHSSIKNQIVPSSTPSALCACHHTVPDWFTSALIYPSCISGVTMSMDQSHYQHHLHRIHVLVFVHQCDFSQIFSFEWQTKHIISTVS
jgi:hypothetical protein